MDDPSAGRFLTARWLRLAMMNYEVDPRSLAPRVPRGTELDAWNGRCFVSLVGFRFLDTRVLGIAVPFHRNFVEVNLRFYVRRMVGGAARRGVVFVKEFVPRRALAWVANLVYNENYQALPMSSEDTGTRVAYEWRHGGRSHRMSLSISGDPRQPSSDSEAAFITEHYWGYVTQRDGSTVEYQVEHPPWRVWQGQEAALEADVMMLYGAEFAAGLQGSPSSCFLAEGSEVVVRRGVKLPSDRGGGRGI
jgi:uncharacterized protein YqjF (DUF2071 family)